MGLSENKKYLISHIVGAILMFMGVGMFITLWMVELPKEMDNGGNIDWVWLIPIIPTSFGAILLFAIDKWVKKVLHIADKASEKISK